MKLTNSWMNDPAYLAQAAHACGAAFYVAAFALLLGRPVPLLGAWLVGVALAALKEFVYDARFELPKQTARDNATDFVFYVVGSAIGWAVVSVAHALGRW